MTNNQPHPSLKKLAQYTESTGKFFLIFIWELIIVLIWYYKVAFLNLINLLSILLLTLLYFVFTYIAHHMQFFEGRMLVKKLNSKNRENQYCITAFYMNSIYIITLLAYASKLINDISNVLLHKKILDDFDLANPIIAVPIIISTSLYIILSYKFQ